jgi:hypothetical protein
VPPLLRAIAVLSFLGVAWFALTLLGETPTRYLIPWAAYAAFAWLLFNVGLVILAIRRVRNLRFAPERRASVRWETDLAGELGILPCRFLDLSLTGARVITAGRFEAGMTRTVRIPLGGDPIELVAIVRTVRVTAGGATVVGLEFGEGQHRARAQLALGLFGLRTAPTAGPAALPARRRRVRRPAVQAA